MKETMMYLRCRWITVCEYTKAYGDRRAWLGPTAPRRLMVTDDFGWRKTGFRQMASSDTWIHYRTRMSAGKDLLTARAVPHTIENCSIMDQGKA